MSLLHGSRTKTSGSSLEDLPMDVDSIVIESDEEGRAPYDGHAIGNQDDFAREFKLASDFIESEAGQEFFEKVNDDLRERMREYLLKAYPDSDGAAGSAA
jgi:hypothetical protein